MSLAEEYMEVAMTTLRHMGGVGKLSAMLGTKTFTPVLEGCGGIQFKFKGCKKMNAVRIELDGNDLYSMEFYKMFKGDWKTVMVHSGLYCDMLKPVFEKTTGLYLSL